MSVMSMFNNLFNGSQPAAQAPVQPQPGNLPAEAPNMQATAANPTAPVSQNPTQEIKKEGLDQFTDLWKPSESPTGAENNQLFNVDPAKLMEAAGKLDFSKAVNPEQLQAIAQGGEGAMQAFAQAMNKVAQTVYAQNAMATTKIVEQAIARTKDGFLGELPQHIKRQQVNDSLRNENPAFSHPAAAPILGALQQQLSVKFPNATATELTSMAKSYLENFASAASPVQKTQTEAAPGEVDWSKFLG